MANDTIPTYCQRDAELAAQVTTTLSRIPFPSLSWLCANLDRWYIDHGCIVLTK